MSIIQKLSDKADEEFITTGVKEIDEMIGGLPRGRLTEFWGAEGCGKSFLASLIVSNASTSGLKTLYVDAEFAISKSRLEALGADPSKIDFVQEAMLEPVAELTSKAVEDGTYDIIVLDSLAALIPLTIVKQEVGENAIGLFARLVKHWVSKMRPALGKSKTAFIVINQYRASLNMYHPPESPGGKAYQHAIDVKLYLTRNNSSDMLKKEGKLVGHWVNIEVKKSRVSPIGMKTKTKLLY